MLRNLRNSAGVKPEWSGVIFVQFGLFSFVQQCSSIRQLPSEVKKLGRTNQLDIVEGRKDSYQGMPSGMP